MGKKKQVEGSVMSIDLPQDPVVEQKKKREISDAQRANLAKGMAALKAKRDAKSKVVEEEVPEAEPVKQTPPITPVPEAAPIVKQKREYKPRVVKNYLTAEDFNSFKSELFTSLKREPVNVQPQPQPQPPTPVVVKETIVQPQVIKEVVKERVISGRELLDKIFNF